MNPDAADELAVRDHPVLPRKRGTAKKTLPLAGIQVKFSDIPAEEKDRLLFEVFDMLLRNHESLKDLSPDHLALSVEKCKVKAKARPPFNPRSRKI